MFVQKKKTKKTPRPTKAISMVESLEGRQMFSASPAPGGEALLSDGKVSTNDISIVKRMDKGSPGFTTEKIKLTDILVSG